MTPPETDEHGIWADDPAPRRALTVTLCLVIACAIIGGAVVGMGVL